jgi:hypothetical protein
LGQFRPSAAGDIFKARVSLKKECVDCITGNTSTNKIVHQLLSKIICVVDVIEPTPIHSIAYIHHPATPTHICCIGFCGGGGGDDDDDDRMTRVYVSNFNGVIIFQDICPKIK